MNKKNNDYLTKVQMVNTKTNEVFYDKLTYYYLELPKFKKEASELKTITDKWIYFIKNANNLEIIPDGFDDPDFVNAFEIANQVTWTSGELDVYEKISHNKWSDKHILESALERGFEQGMEKGRKDGEKNKAIAIAKNISY